MVGAADPHRCPMTGCTDGSIVSRFSMPPVKTLIYHAPVGKRDSLHPRVGQLGNLHMLGSGWVEAPRWVYWVCYSAVRQEQGLSAPCPTLRCQGYTYSTQPFSSSDPGPPPDVKDNSRTRMHACLLSCFSCVQLCDTMDYSLPGSSVHGIVQTRMLEWIATPSSRGSSWPRDRNQISCITGGFSATSKAQRNMFHPLKLLWPGPTHGGGQHGPKAGARKRKLTGNKCPSHEAVERQDQRCEWGFHWCHQTPPIEPRFQHKTLRRILKCWPQSVKLQVQGPSKHRSLYEHTGHTPMKPPYFGDKQTKIWCANAGLPNPWDR